LERLPKIGLVAAGYGAALLAAFAAVALRVAATSGPAAQASSGMYAAGDAMLFVAVFAGVGVVPTGAALFFLRPYRRFWIVLSRVALGVAVSGLVAAILYAAGRRAGPSPLATWAGLSVLRLLAAPLLAPTFAVCAALAPDRLPRLTLLAAAAMEGTVCVCIAVVWFVPAMFGGR
jgi:hypothetical protein